MIIDNYLLSIKSPTLLLDLATWKHNWSKHTDLVFSEPYFMQTSQLSQFGCEMHDFKANLTTINIHDFPPQAQIYI